MLPFLSLSLADSISAEREKLERERETGGREKGGEKKDSSEFSDAGLQEIDKKFSSIVSLNSNADRKI